MFLKIETIDLRRSIPKNKGRKWTLRQLKDIKIVAVHHEGGQIRSDKYDEETSIFRMADYHIAKNWGTPARPAHAPTTPYHFVIGRSGLIYWCNDLKNVTWHANFANPIAVSVLLQGNLTKQEPTKEQLQALYDVLMELTEHNRELNLDHGDVYGHGELKGRGLAIMYYQWRDFGNYTACPGSVLRYVQEFRNTGEIKGIASMKNPDAPDEVGEFMDVEDGEWYAPFARTMIETGIMRGFGDGTWRPSELATRAQIAKIVIGAMLKHDEVVETYKKMRIDKQKNT